MNKIYLLAIYSHFLCQQGGEGGVLAETLIIITLSFYRSSNCELGRGVLTLPRCPSHDLYRRLSVNVSFSELNLKTHVWRPLLTIIWVITGRSHKSLEWIACILQRHLSFRGVDVPFVGYDVLPNF